MKKTFRVAPALCTALVLCVAGCSGQGGGGGGGSSSSATKTQNDPLEGCPKGASEEYKTGWAEAVNGGRDAHERFIRWRTEKIMTDEFIREKVTDLREGMKSDIVSLRRGAANGGGDYFQGQADGRAYVLRHILRPSY